MVLCYEPRGNLFLLLLLLLLLLSSFVVVVFSPNQFDTVKGYLPMFEVSEICFVSSY